MSTRPTTDEQAANRERSRASSLLIWFGLVIALALAVSPASAVCQATGKSCGSNSPSNDRLCCPGMVCGWGNVCQAGCRINGTFYQNGAKNPGNACQSCQPSRSTTQWSNLSAGTACGSSSVSVCDRRDTCNGSGSCLSNFEPATKPCGSPSDTVCDNPDRCSGTSAACLPNNEPTTTNCGDPEAPCVNQDKCNGAGACTDNGFKLATTACGSESDTECDNPDRCSGTSSACLPNFEPTTTNCGDPEAPCVNQDKCNGAGACTDNGFKLATTECGSDSDTECDNPDRCSGTSAACLEHHEPATTSCGDPSSGSCDGPDHCSGTNGNCAPNNVADGTECNDGNDVATPTDICSGGTCVGCVADDSASPRFVDNGPTVTDLKTCLVWEKKTAGTGVVCDTPTACPDPHVVGHRYQWSSTGTLPDGGVFTDFLVKLNTAGFAGHSDWRLPTTAGCCGFPTGQPAELESIVETGHGAPLINSIFGPTASFPYWASSAFSATPVFVWYVDFGFTIVSYDYKNNVRYVRAVRGGPECAGVPDGTTCDDGNASTPTDICSSGSCVQCVPNAAAVPPGRFVDNGLTVTDLKTCLVWEKKTGTVDLPVSCDTPTTCPDPHVVNNTFEWSSTGTLPDGGAFTDFLVKLNTAGFAGHSDWRLPTSAGCCDTPTGQPAELESIVETVLGAPSINSIFGPTASYLYWSLSTLSDNPGIAWAVSFDSFDGGDVRVGSKWSDLYLRAVRGGP